MSSLRSRRRVPVLTARHTCGHGAAPFGIAVALLALWTAACSSSEVAVTSPSAAKCHVTAASSLSVAPAAGASGSLTVTTNRDCTWAASSAAAWVVITSTPSGQGDGTIAYRVAANNDPVRRDTAIDVNDTRIAIAQAAAECHFAVDPQDAAAPASGGSVTVRVQPTANCGWTASVDAPWVHVTAGSSGTGPGSVTIGVDRNTGAARSAAATIADQTVRITQADGLASGPAPPPGAPSPCLYSITPSGQMLAAAGGTGSIAVTAGPTCAWTAVSNAAWLTLTAGVSGTGDGTVAFAATPNPGGSRTGTISVAGQTVTVTQAALACTYSISPSADSLPAGGGTTTVSVTAGAACGWVASSNAPWITIASGASGTGNGAVQLVVAPNAGAARTGTATIAGHTYTVSQAAAPCTIVLSPSLISIPAAGGPGSTNVSAGAGCGWTATSNAGWITITGDASGAGNGSVAFSAAANSGPARSGTLTIGGQTLTVTQAAACTFTVAPSSASVPAAGGSGSVSVTAPGGCAWTAQANDQWLSVTAGASGTGSGSVDFSAAANSGALRTGTLTVAGQTVMVTQDAPCTFSITPTAQTLGAQGGSGSIAVTTGAACTWTATSSDPSWLTITAGASGTGPGNVAFAAAPDSGPTRTATIDVAGQTFTLTQTNP